MSEVLPARGRIYTKVVAGSVVAREVAEIEYFGFNKE